MMKAKTDGDGNAEKTTSGFDWYYFGNSDFPFVPSNSSSLQIPVPLEGMGEVVENLSCP